MPIQEKFQSRVWPRFAEIVASQRRPTALGRTFEVWRTHSIIDRHVNLPEGTVIGYDLEADRARYSVTENGIVVVVRPESMLEELHCSPPDSSMRAILSQLQRRYLISRNFVSNAPCIF